MTVDWTETPLVVPKVLLKAVRSETLKAVPKDVQMVGKRAMT
jgi:hypothetical protein